MQKCINLLFFVSIMTRYVHYVVVQYVILFIGYFNAVFNKNVLID